MKPNSLIENFYKKVLQSNGSLNNGKMTSNTINDALSDDDSSDDDFVINESSDELSEDENEDDEDSSSSESVNTNDSKSSNEKLIKKTEVIPIVKENKNFNNSNNIKEKIKPKLDKKICCVCLNEQSESTDEIVQCDSCGYFTHEGCYGISEADSRHSSDSLESTEPWFCNSCLSNQNKPKCELCPNEQCGLLKETQSGRFVHIVCALYSPDVSFEDTDKLWPVVLNEISFKKWGDRICSLCDNLYLSRSGICIKCDAGLCKAYFHVTCAMKHGLLVDPSQQNANDPFFAYCKQHNDSDQIRQRKLKYFQMIETSNHLNLSLNDRIKLKFKHAKIDYNLKRSQVRIPRPDQQKIARSLTTNPSTLKQLIQKSHLNTSQHSMQKHSANQVTFTIEFVKHYYDRELKLAQFNQEIPQMKKVQSDLTNQEQEMRLNYEAKLNEKDKLVNEFSKQIKIFDACINMFIENKKLKQKLKDLFLNQEHDSDESLNTSSLNSSTTNSQVTKQTSTQTTKRTYKRQKPQFKNQISLDAECSICKQKTNSHLLVECDTCKTYYHINCLEPPLTVVPKKTKLYGWECAKCVRKKGSDFDEENEEKLDQVDEKRSLRRERKQTRSVLQDTLEMENLLKLVKKKSKRGRKKKRNQTKKLNQSKSSNESIPKQIQPKKRRPYTKRNKVDNIDSSIIINASNTEDTIPRNDFDSFIDSVVQESIIINTSDEDTEDIETISEEAVKKKLRI